MAVLICKIANVTESYQYPVCRTLEYIYIYLQRWSNQRTLETQTPTKFNFRAPTTKYMSCQAIERHEKTFYI